MQEMEAAEARKALTEMKISQNQAKLKEAEERLSKMTPIEQTRTIINEKAEEQCGPGWSAAAAPGAKVYSFVGKSAAEVGSHAAAWQ